MFGSLQLVIAAAIAAAAASSTWWVTRDHYLGVIAADKVAVQKQVDAANLKADNAAIDWQAWAEVQPAKIVYRNRKVANAFKAEPVWAAASIPSAVRVLLDAPAPGSDADPAVADSAMPAASAASAADQSGSGPGISGFSRFFGHVFKAPQRVDQGAAPATPAGEMR